MATFPTITQNGGAQTWISHGGNITNHEAFAFTLKAAPANVGALMVQVAVFRNTVFVANQTSYEILLAVVDQDLNLSNATITGNFDSDQV